MVFFGLNLLIMVIKLSNFRCDFPNLPPFQPIFRIENQTVLLLKLPQFCVNIKRSSKVCLPLFVTILWKISKSFKFQKKSPNISGNTDRSPLNSCFDFSKRWQNSITTFRSCSSIFAIPTMIFLILKLHLSRVDCICQ